MPLPSSYKSKITPWLVLKSLAAGFGLVLILLAVFGALVIGGSYLALGAPAWVMPAVFFGVLGLFMSAAFFSEWSK